MSVEKVDEIPTKIPPYFSCFCCDYITCSKKDYNKHIETKKHKINQNQLLATKKSPNDSCFICFCGKSYKDKSGLWRHRKRCLVKEENEQISSNNIVNNNNIQEHNDTNVNTNVLMEVIKQNQEFQKFMMEQMVEISKNCNTTNNNINNTNNTFNLQVFLNEKCKDAMNIDEFVDSLKLTFNDLESVGELGFVKGISRIFINGLKQLDVYKRPIHCSDLKREVIHLKDAGVWEKDNENKDIMKKLVKMIANKNINKIYEWREAYPNHRYSDDPKNDIYLKIAYQSMGAKTKEDDIAFYEKIIKNVAKEVTINKNRD